MMALTGLPVEYLEALDVERFAELARVLFGELDGDGGELDERAAAIAERRRGSRLEDLPPELGDPASFAIVTKGGA